MVTKNITIRLSLLTHIIETKRLWFNTSHLIGEIAPDGLIKELMQEVTNFDLCHRMTAILYPDG